MFSPKTSYAKIAYDAILFFVLTGQVRKEGIDKISADLKLNRACIVSIYDLNDALRENYGEVIPKNKILYDEIVENAINAASQDKKKAIQSSDLSQIKVYVDVLSVLHKTDDFNELKPKKHGIFVKDEAGKSGFVMPNIKGIDTVVQQIERAKQNAGIIAKDNSKLEILFFKSTRYD